MAKILPSLAKLLLSLLFLLGVQWAEAQVSGPPAAPQPGPGQQPDQGTRPGGGLPGAPSGGLVRPAPAPTGLGGNVNGAARQSSVGNALLAPAPQAIGAGMSGFGGFPAPAATGQPGFGTGAGMFGTLAPVTVRGDLSQPGIAGTGLGPVNTGGAGLPLITTSSRAQLANTGYGATAQAFGFGPYVGTAANVNPGLQPTVVHPAWTVAPPSQATYGSLGPPYGVMAGTAGAPAAGSVGTFRPAPIALGRYTPDDTAVRPVSPAQTTVRPQTYPRPWRSYWFKLGQGGLGASPERQP